MQEIIVTAQRAERRVRDVSVSVNAVSSETLDAAAVADDAGQSQPDAEPAGAPETAGIEAAPWSPGRPWIAALDNAGSNWASAIEQLRTQHGSAPVFWFDVAEWLFRHNHPAEARRAVESALDLETRDNQTLSIVAARLQRYGGLDRAIALIEQLCDREDERPQPPRTLAVLLMQRAEVHRVAGHRDAALADLRRAIALLADSVLTIRRENARGFERTALMDANLAVQRYRALGGRDHALPTRLVQMLDTDIRIVMEWNTPRTDLDLWVEQPNGEDVGFSYRLARNGGQLTDDVTTGYGPEEFLLHAAGPGTYIIRAKTYATDRTNPNGPSSLAVRIIRNFGRANQSEELLDIEMDPDLNDRQQVGTIVIR